MRNLPRLTAGAVVCTVALTGCATASDHASHSTSTAAPASTISQARAADVMFAQMMIPHHQQAVQMADLALAPSAGASAAVKKLATQIRKAQAPEIVTMQGWLKSWNAELPSGATMHHGMGMMTEADMASLKSLNGKAFDKKWLTMMIAHHQGAVQMAQDVLKTSKDSQVRKLATSMVSSQNTEIKTMQGML